MKNTNKIIALILVLAISLVFLASCAGGNVASSGTATVVIETGAEGDEKYQTYSVDLSKLQNRNEGALSLLEYIASLEGSTLYYNVQWGGGYGAYITAIGSLSPNPMSEYIAVYTSEEKDFAVPDAYMPTVSTVAYGEMTLTYSGVGISTMTINDGTVVLFRLQGF